MNALKATVVDGRVLLELPLEMAGRLNISEGGIVMANDHDGDVRLTAAPDDFADLLSAAEEVMEENRWVLQQLAK
ncbi:AbrB/MazE/SpoVT family DNA-binding domain-containing protein [Aerophototrophica crusticola]|uniref:AbrB/MazE/SpoVT family DNA-binding domain-containing protein n=1 Tax=Aerophototrophica crusticola TaxID=1709002 RepID=A0A858R3Q2_9PROT|nr:AbrB/MazE/SpoVT family DNA-binding domain-containing protein [Rhodospirillaceae bacterium B3]